jgi:hypothetical protein
MTDQIVEKITLLRSLRGELARHSNEVLASSLDSQEKRLKLDELSQKVELVNRRISHEIEAIYSASRLGNLIG